MYNDPTQAIEYAEGVVSGKIVAGKYIKLQCQKFIDDLKNPKYEYHEEEVSKCLKFLNVLKHFKGAVAGQQFILEKFQVFIVANIVGLYIAGTNYRKYTQSYLQMSRKSGKSFFINSLALYYLIADKENSPEILVLANSRKQALEVDYDTLAKICGKLDPKQKIIKQYRDNLKSGFNDGKLIVLSSESKTGDGYNCSFGIIDEYHESPNQQLRDLIISSQQARDRAHCCIITTAGFNLFSPCKQLRDYCCEVLEGLKNDESIFSMIYELDPSDDWKDSENWVKANPSLGVTVPRTKLEIEVLKAINNPCDSISVKTKNLNIWCSSNSVWLPSEKILSVSKEFNLSDYAGSEVYLGVDLSSVSDLTAVSIFIPEHNLFYTYYFLPESALETKPDKEKYRQWGREKYITYTPGNVVDYDFITTEIMKLSSKFRIKKIFYDSWNSTQWAIDATSKGLQLEPHSQNLASFNRPTKEFERLVLSENIIIHNNPITRFCLSNVSLKYDHNNNCKPIKTKNESKIDGVISMLQALGGYLQNPISGGSITFF